MGKLPAWIEKIMLPVISGVIAGISLLYIVHWLAWIMLVPLFYAILTNQRSAFFKGFVSGTVAGLIVFSWMISSAAAYTGTSTYIGFPIWVLCSIYMGFISGIILMIFALLKIKSKFKNVIWLNAILLASVWVIVDWLRSRIFPGMPWMNYSIALTQSSWVIPLQLTSITGLWGLIFMIVIVNYSLASFIVEKKYYQLWIPSTIYGCLLLAGIIMLKLSLSARSKPVKIALICENMDARKRWLPETADSLAAIFFDLNYKASGLKPQLIIWSESAIPWNLAMDDDLITQCLRITWPSKAGHIIGIFSPYEKDTSKRYNSAYYIEPDGAITGRYDKVQLLSFLEKPFMRAKLPFFSESAHTDIVPGEKRQLLKTPYGNAGMLICNEITAPIPYRSVLKKGARFFIIMSNDAWFEDTMVTLHHFYTVRLRAVEIRKDFAVNSNRGYSGIIHSSGLVQSEGKGEKPDVIAGDINTLSRQSFYARYGDWLVLLNTIYFTIIIFYKSIFLTKQN
jgi:apolipoprotein N-acyltransferase